VNLRGVDSAELVLSSFRSTFAACMHTMLSPTVLVDHGAVEIFRLEETL